ncbi:hypothetical protein DB30_00689 [Enhygromyxa salina]|uniref:Uncharacterized protein n=1 Tax=Enhygromyxa salina TaxID=215803 RepID=A0A0C1ZLJ7_9BACT|nr:hypothetical protein [Enhygromyxa salina]KIG18404.1 hypothetical protein DB30_00689 [Enhygromyxa salina]
MSAWLAWLLFAAATGQDRPVLTVHADPCLELDTALLHDTVKHQLGAGLDYRGDVAAQAGHTQILLDCSVDQRVEITVIDPLTQISTTQIVDLPAPPRRGEQLGWAAAALLRSTWMNLGGEQDRASRRAARVAQRPPSPWQLGDGFVVRSYFDRRSPALMLGEQAEVLHRPRRHFAWKADGELSYWRVPVAVGEEAGLVNTFTVSVAPSLLAWGEFPGRGPRGAGTVAIYGGAGFRVGGVRMRSTSFGDSAGFQAYAGPLSTAQLSVSMGRFVRLAVNAELGWILHGPVQPQGVPLSLVGPWANGVFVIVSSF